MKISIILYVLLLSSFSANAEYCATGVIKGNICSGFILESCKTVKIDAVKGENGELFSINKCYSSVSEYSKSKKLCWINTKSKGGGALSWAANSLTQPDFLHKNESGKYEELDVEYLVFKCTKN